MEMAVITVGAIHGGTKRNIIPEDVVMNLTIRSFSAELSLELARAVERTAHGLARAMGLPEDLLPRVVQAETSYPPVINDPELTAELREAFASLLGPENIRPAQATTGSEDFSFFRLYDPPVPQVMFQLGVTSRDRLEAAEKGGPKVSPVHDPRFHPELHPSLETGLSCMAAAALSGLAAPKEGK